MTPNVGDDADRLIDVAGEAGRAGMIVPLIELSEQAWSVTEGISNRDERSRRHAAIVDELSRYGAIQQALQRARCIHHRVFSSRALASVVVAIAETSDFGRSRELV